MKIHQTIEADLADSVMTVRLNRPDKHNAFDETMLREVTDCFRNLPEEVLCVVLRGNGKSFCAGVDLNWMKEVAKNSYEKNYRESLLLSECFYSIYTCPRPTIAVVHGVSLGGANGLLAACDIAYAAEDAVFSLSEVKIGIIPACISPYIIKRIGEYPSRELMLTGRRISGKEAEKYHLVNKAVPADGLDQELGSLIASLRTSGPRALGHVRKLIFDITNNLTLDEAYDQTARMIADIRASEEGQEGMAAFLEKRKPNWIK
jgi:methylglutaconyl-CoA hydratase